MKKKANKKQAVYWIVSEISFFAALYYLLYILKAQANLWLASLILFVLINISIISCPVLSKYCK